MADKAERLWSARVAEIRAAAEDSGTLITRHIQQPGLVVDGEVRVNVEFAFARFDDGTSVLLLRPGDPEPYVIVEEHLDADSGEVVFYNYDLVEPSRGIYGHHYHGHGGEPTPPQAGHRSPGWARGPGRQDRPRGCALGSSGARIRVPYGSRLRHARTGTGDRPGMVARGPPCATLRAMSQVPVRWSGAAVPERPVERRAQLVSLPAGTPSVETLFTFMRDAELRFTTLRLRVVERTWTAQGESQRTHEVLVRHPDRVRVTIRYADRELPHDHEIWLTDGTQVCTYSAIHDLATVRPVRRRLVGLDSPDLPATSRVFRPLTILPHASLAELMIHPAGFCQNVLGTGPVRITGSTRVAGREAVTLAADHPRTAHVVADRPDHAFELAVDAELGLVTRLVERLGDRVTRHAEATSVETDAAIADSVFELAVPASARRIY